MGAVVAVGGVAAAIAAIVALIELLQPDPTPELRAELTDVLVDNPVTLDVYAARHETETAWAPGGATASRLAADVMVQAEPTTTTTTPTTTTTTGTTPTTTTTTGTTPTTTTTTEDGDEDIVREPALSKEDVEDLNGGLDLMLSDPASYPVASQTDVGEACAADLSNPACGLRSAATYLLRPQSEVTEETVADQLVKLFDHVRKEPPPPAEESVLGVPVYFNFSLTGFRGRTVDVRFSLFDADGQVPYDWLKSQSVLLLEAEAQKDSGSGEFWVPLPSEPGQYFIRLGVYDEDDDPLDYERTRGSFE